MLGVLASRGGSIRSIGPRLARARRGRWRAGFPGNSSRDGSLEGMMAAGHKLGEPVEAGSSGLRRVRRWRLLLAHDATSATCDSLIDAIEGALGNVDIYESSAIDDARVALLPDAHGGRFDVCMVC